MMARAMVLLCLLSGSAWAEERCGGDVGARIAYLQQRRAHDERRTRIWAATWAGVFTAIVGYEAAWFATHSDHDARVDAVVGMGAAGIGLVVLAVQPGVVFVDERLHPMPPPGDRCATLAELERRLSRDAAAQEFGTSPLIHAGNFVFNIGIGLLLGLGFGHWQQAVINMLVGIAVGEAEAITQPTDSVDTLAAYRAGRLDGRAARRWRLAPSLSRDGAALAFALDF